MIQIARPNDISRPLSSTMIDSSSVSPHMSQKRFGSGAQIADMNTRQVLAARTDDTHYPQCTSRLYTRSEGSRVIRYEYNARWHPFRRIHSRLPNERNQFFVFRQETMWAGVLHTTPHKPSRHILCRLHKSLFRRRKACERPSSKVRFMHIAHTSAITICRCTCTYIASWDDCAISREVNACLQSVGVHALVVTLYHQRRTDRYRRCFPSNSSAAHLPHDNPTMVTRGCVILTVPLEFRLSCTYSRYTSLADVCKQAIFSNLNHVPK